MDKYLQKGQVETQHPIFIRERQSMYFKSMRAPLDLLVSPFQAWGPAVQVEGVMQLILSTCGGSGIRPPSTILPSSIACFPNS
jgi:hypothetical protein